MNINGAIIEDEAGELVCMICHRRKFGPRGYIPCACESEGRVEVPARFRGSADKQPRPAQSAAWNTAMAWAEALGPRTRTGLYLWGPPGSGKTTLAWALMEIAAKKALSTLGYEMPHLLATAREAMKLEADAPGRACREVKLLLLDDLGAERFTEFAAQTVGEIITYRYSQHLPTLFTSNLSPERLREPSTPWLGSYADERIAERIREMCQPVFVGGKQRGKL